MSHFLIGGLNALLAWWLENNRPYSAEYMARAFHQLVVMGLRGVLSGKRRYRTRIDAGGWYFYVPSYPAV
jgi:hypothetical protein